MPSELFLGHGLQVAKEDIVLYRGRGQRLALDDKMTFTFA
jgi:hypothetical protein